MRYGRRLLAATLTLFGAICGLIAMAHIAVGPRAIRGGVVTNAVMDSEDRFFASLFLGFAIGVIWAARDLERRHGVLGGLLLTFFAGGIARIISIAAVGSPGSLFLFLGSLELILPPLFWWWLRATQR